jgi:eukaryotic-like serine/threonine-protein kinase
MAAPQTIDRQTFLANVRQSGLVRAEQLAEAVRGLPDTNRGRLVARALVEAGLLTRFQAERLLAGRTAGFFLGQYRILDQVGRGGMGRVFKAEHLTLQRVVALKVLMPHALESDRARELFLREVRAAAQLVHPNIVTAYDANETDGRFFLVLEYVDGPNLEQLVRKQGPLAVGLACDYVRQAASGLQCAHAAGMVHRDVKPANILVQRRGTDDATPGLVKVSDFGLARLHAPGAPAGAAPGTILTRDNTVMGTPDYLSPEQSRSLHKTDIRSDIYSLGCTFYFLLTGQAPFPGGNALEKLIRHSTEAPRPLSAFRQDVPPEVQAVVGKMMAKRPDDRYRTPAEAAAALGPFAVSGPIPWAPPSQTLPIVETPTPNPGDSSGELAVLDELAGLGNTVPAAHAPTPVHPMMPSGAARRSYLTRRQRRERWLRVVVAALGGAFVATVVCLAVMKMRGAF